MLDPVLMLINVHCPFK